MAVGGAVRGLPELARVVYYGLKRGAVYFERFMLQLKAERIIGKSALSPEELTRFKALFEEAKSAAAEIKAHGKSLGMLEEDVDEFVDLWAGTPTSKLDEIKSAMTTEVRGRDILDEFAGHQRTQRGAAKQEAVAEAGMKEARTPGKSVPAYLERGQLAHKWAELLIPESKLPRGLKAEVKASLPGGEVRLDRVDFKEGVYYEIKPTTQTAAGKDQIAKYAEYMNKNFPLPGGKKWIGRVVTYEKTEAVGLFGF
jgi:hypothetical protein